MDIEELSKSAMDVEAMAEEAAAAFYENAVKYGIAKYPKLGVRRTRNWSKFLQIARVCKAKSVDVRKFVDTAYVDAMSRHPIVSVADILSFDTDRMSERKYDSHPADMWNLLASKLLDTVFSVNGVADKAAILVNPMYGYPAWFRVFFPEKPVADILANWSDIAAEELAADNVLDAYLKEQRPETYALLQRVVAAAGVSKSSV